MDILQLQEMANTMPTQALIQAAQNSDSQIPPFLALTVLNERKKMNMAGDAQQAQSQLAQQPPTVAQGVMQGVSGLPTGSTVPQQYTGGGIVAFADGGSANDWNAREKSQWARYLEMVGQGVKPVMAIAADAFTAVPRGLMGAGNAGIGGLRAAGMPVPYMKDILAPEGSRFESATPWYDRYARGQQTAQPPQPLQSWQATPQWGGDMQGQRANGPSIATPGIAPPGVNERASASVMSSGRGGASIAAGYPEFVDPRTGAAPRITEEQRDAMVMAQYEKLKALYGPDAAEAYLKQIQGEREELKGRGKQNENEAWLRAGLAMLGGRSKWGSVNIGEGGLQGLNAYQQGRTQLDAQRRELRRDEMQAAAAAQARQDQVRGASIGAAERQAERGDRQRAEDIAVAGQQMAHKVGAAEFGLGVRKLDIEMLKAKAEISRAVQSGELSKQDAAARIYQSAQEGALKIIKAEVAAAEKNPMGTKSPYASMSEAEQFAASQEMAKRWIDNNAPLATIVGHRQAPTTRKWPGQQ